MGEKSDSAKDDIEKNKKKSAGSILGSTNEGGTPGNIASTQEGEKKDQDQSTDPNDKDKPKQKGGIGPKPKMSPMSIYSWSAIGKIFGNIMSLQKLKEAIKVNRHRVITGNTPGKAASKFRSKVTDKFTGKDNKPDPKIAENEAKKAKEEMQTKKNDAIKNLGLDTADRSKVTQANKDKIKEELKGNPDKYKVPEIPSFKDLQAKKDKGSNNSKTETHSNNKNKGSNNP